MQNFAPAGFSFPQFEQVTGRLHLSDAPDERCRQTRGFGKE